MFLVHLDPSWAFSQHRLGGRKKMKCARSAVDPLPAMLLSEIFIQGIPPLSPPAPNPLRLSFLTRTHRIEQLLQVSDAGSALLVPVARAVISGPRGSMRGCVFECGVALPFGHERARSFTPMSLLGHLQSQR